MEPVSAGGGRRRGWQLATRAQIHQLFLDVNIPLTDLDWVSDPTSQARVQDFVVIFGQTDTNPSISGTHLWHANTFDDPATVGTQSALWMTADDEYWAGDNGTTLGLSGTAQPNFGVALVRSVSGVSENLLLNGGFDVDLSGWDNAGLASWSSEDAEGSLSSGSARLSISASAYAIRSTCVTAGPGDVFLYSARYLVPPGQQATGNATIQMGIFDQETCTGVSLGTSEDVGTQTFWSTLGNRIVTPAGTASVRVFPFDRRLSGPGDFTVHFDDVELVVVSDSLIDWVPVGAPGNAAAANQLGAVGYSYEIGTYEVDNTQYVEFLNAVASTDDFGLFNPNMESDDTFGGIVRSGSPGSYSYVVKPGFQLNPVVFVSFWEALLFVNWLHNGEPTGMQDASTTEDGAYTLTPDAIANNTVVRNPWATIVLPNLDEWYKAAYFDPTTSIYFDYPAGTDEEIGCVVPPSDTANAPTALAAGFGGTIERVAESTGIGFRVVKVPELGATPQMLLALATVWFARRRSRGVANGRT